MARKEFTHRGTISNSTGWSWGEQLRETDKYWISSVQNSTGEVVKYRKKDGKRLGGSDMLDLTSVKESR